MINQLPAQPQQPLVHFGQTGCDMCSDGSRYPDVYLVRNAGGCFVQRCPNHMTPLDHPLTCEVHGCGWAAITLDHFGMRESPRCNQHRLFVCEVCGIAGAIKVYAMGDKPPTARCAEHRDGTAADIKKSAEVPLTTTDLSMLKDYQRAIDDAQAEAREQVRAQIDPIFRFFCGLTSHLRDLSPEVQREYRAQIEALGKLLKGADWGGKPKKNS